MKEMWKQKTYHLLKEFVLLGLLFVFFSCSHGENVEDIHLENINWSVYQGDDGRNQYSPLKQITPENINNLKKVWEFHTNDAEERTQIQCNPLVIDGIMYATSPQLKVVAVNAANGKLIWEFNPKTDVNLGLNANRGLVLYQNSDEKTLFFTAGPMLFAIDAKTGKRKTDFGYGGVVSLKEGLGDRSSDLYVVATTPGVIYENLLIVGSRVLEGPEAAPGHIRAFDVKSGALVWTFNTIPQPGEEYYDTWPEEAYGKIGGANSWAGMSIDRKKGIIYIPTGSAAFDFWGGNREGDNLFANCILALNAKTGKRIWHYQTVHHDLWDRDLPAPPNIVDLTINGTRKEAVAQITKSGFVFVLDRNNGTPLFEIEERKVPVSDIKGEISSPTQPFPSKPPAFARQDFSLDEITNINPEATAYVNEMVKDMRFGGQFIPPSLEGTILLPGYDGGGEWGGASVDPTRGIMYVNASEMPYLLQLAPKVDGVDQDMQSLGSRLYQMNCAVCHGQDLSGDISAGYPPLNAIQERLEDKEITSILKSGKGFMPSFQHLTEIQMQELVNFLKGIDSESENEHMIGINDQQSEIPFVFTGYKRLLDQNGYPAIKPPWGLLSAIDLNKGEMLWQVPLGEFEELTKLGIPKTGTENYGGPVATAGGILFIAATKDEYIRAFDMKNGDELWKYKLPAGGYATPAIYSIEGKQYVVIASGGGKMGTGSGDSYIAFALEE